MDGLVSMSKFRRDPGIPNDVRIEVPRSHEIAIMVEGNNDFIPDWIWLIHQAGLGFPISPLLKEMMAHCSLTFMQVSVNFVRTVLTMDTHAERETTILC